MCGANSTAAQQSLQRFVCAFDRHVSPDKGRISKSEILRIEFTIDGTGHAFAVGRNVYPVQVVTGDQGITFLEVLATGAVQTTTVHRSGDAVHSRHTMFSFLNKVTPSQYYGSCQYISNSN